MSKNNFTRLTREDFPEQGEWINKLLHSHNQLIDAMSARENGLLSLQANTQSEWLSFDIQVNGDEVTPVKQSADSIADHISSSNAHDASAISLTGVSGISAGTVKGALEEHEIDLAGKLSASGGVINGNLEVTGPITWERVYTRVRKSTGSALNHNTFTPITWNVVDWDTHSGWVSSSRYEIPIVGEYLIDCFLVCNFTGSAGGEFIVEIRINGTTYKRVRTPNPRGGSGDTDFQLHASHIMPLLTVGDYVEIWALQSSGSGKATGTNSVENNLTITRLGGGRG